jgi:predicted RNase H-like nuclease (RuvC/YqgF family)
MMEYLAAIITAVAGLIGSIGAIYIAVRQGQKNKAAHEQAEQVKTETQKMTHETQQVKEDAQDVITVMHNTLALYKNTVEGLERNERERRREIVELRDEITQCEDRSARAQGRSEHAQAEAAELRKEVFSLRATNTELNHEITKLIRRVDDLLQQIKIHEATRLQEARDAAANPAPPRGIYSRHNRPIHHRTTQRRGRIVSELDGAQVLVQWSGGETSSIAADEIIEEQ